MPDQFTADALAAWHALTSAERADVWRTLTLDAPDPELLPPSTSAEASGVVAEEARASADDYPDGRTFVADALAAAEVSVSAWREPTEAEVAEVVARLTART